MALRPTKKHVPKLTSSQVVEIRKLYFYDNWSLSQLAIKYDASKGLMQKAVSGIGSFYGSIEDDIPQEVKKNRVSIKEIRGTFDDGKHWQKHESKASAARHRREAEEREAKEQARLEEIRREIREKYGKKN